MSDIAAWRRKRRSPVREVVGARHRLRLFRAGVYIDLFAATVPDESSCPDVVRSDARRK